MGDQPKSGGAHGRTALTHTGEATLQDPAVPRTPLWPAVLQVLAWDPPTAEKSLGLGMTAAPPSDPRATASHPGPERNFPALWVSLTACLAVLVLGGSAAITWYLLTELPAEQMYFGGSLRFINAAYSLALADRSSSNFQLLARALQQLIGNALLQPEQQWHCICVNVTAFSEGSVIAHFLLSLEVNSRVDQTLHGSDFAQQLTNHIKSSHEEYLLSSLKDCPVSGLELHWRGAAPCRWELRAGRGQRVRLTLHSQSSGGDCEQDFIAVYDSLAAGKARLITRLCPGSEHRPLQARSVLSSSRVMLVILHSQQQPSAGLWASAHFLQGNRETCAFPAFQCHNTTCIEKPSEECDSTVDCPDTPEEMACGCGRRGEQESRVVGGQDAQHGEWPWQASLHFLQKHVCGATIIGPRWLLSAAHCFQDPTQRRVSSAWLWTAVVGTVSRQAGGPGSVLHVVRRIITHEQYNMETLDSDLALLELERPLEFSSSVQPVCLPPRSHSIPAGQPCFVTGWGLLQEDGVLPLVLQKGQVQVIAQAECSRYLGGSVTVNMLCAGQLQGGVDACQGDSGGPLVCQARSGRWVQAGVVSWGEGCARRQRPGVYTRLSQFQDWISQQVGV